MKNSGLWVIALAFAIGGIWSARADTVTYEMVPVGNAGNAADTNGYGAVNYAYSIGKYDVTIGQYATFLNAVAAADPYGLWAAGMNTNTNVSGISRSGSSGSYTYAVLNNSGSSANRPITLVNWFDAARFANWMANGQPTGAASATTTEDGAYNLNGATSGSVPVKNATNPNTSAAPIYWIPTENEWYKAAYYQPTASGGPSDSYWAYATKSDSAPGNTVGSGANLANYYVGTAPTGSYTTGGGSYSGSQNYLTDVGAFTGSASYYGTFDQAGLVHQWNDLNGTSSANRGWRGGYWESPAFNLSSSSRTANVATYQNGNLGIRLAGPASTPVPEIDPAGMASVFAFFAGALGLLERRRPSTR